MKRTGIFSKIYLLLLLAMMYVPIAIVVLYSFNASKSDVVWGGFSLEWYRLLVSNRDLIEALFNSIRLGVISCVIAAVIATLAATAMSAGKFRGQGIIEYVSTLPIMIPEIILGMVFLSFFSLLNLPFGMVTLVIAHVSFCIPYIFMLVKGRLTDIDPAVYESARDLGASEIRIFFDITLPLIRPGIISGMLLAFAMSFDDVVISVFVTGAKFTTLPVKIYTQLKTGVTPEINALCSIILVVTFVVVFLSEIIRRK